jgi:protein-S-isoprenylcysteine O-methyltransferase Ste14
MLGFLLQWPTVITLAMFPVLVVAYARLARREEREAAAVFGAAWTRYARDTPAFLPRLEKQRRAAD